jgi:hypothetical protein
VLNIHIFSILVIRNNEIAFHSFNAIGSLAAPPFDTLIPDDITVCFDKIAFL